MFFQCVGILFARRFLAFGKVFDRLWRVIERGNKLKLPPGWKYRVKVLDQDLTIKAVNGVAHITQDDLQNAYDACFQEGGQKACTIQP